MKDKGKWKSLNETIWLSREQNRTTTKITEIQKKKSNSDYFTEHSVSGALKHATSEGTEKRVLGIEVSLANGRKVRTEAQWELCYLRNSNVEWQPDVKVQN